ncbi:hypothetical protein AcV5_003434 [Taiwanofungus camphoratus]|nr:hypothetical protein AcV5_003434 [Antrodia cinnamomea]
MPAPTKRVHFDLPPPTPSPTYSNSSLPSSGGPRTPLQLPLSPESSYLTPAPYLPPSKQPQGVQVLSPTSFGSSPYVSGQVQLHPLLMVPYHGFGPTLAWDMRNAPSTAYFHVAGPPRQLSLTADVLAQPATHPALPALTLICDLLPWLITITPSTSAAWSPGPLKVVTVGDVLYTLYRTLRLPVAETELSYLRADGQACVHAAFHARYRMIDDQRQRAEEKGKGVKRVDFLMEARVFSGLSMVTGGAVMTGKGLGEVWALHLALSS